MIIEATGSYELSKHFIPQQGTRYFVDAIKCDKHGKFVDPLGSYGSEAEARTFIAGAFA